MKRIRKIIALLVLVVGFIGGGYVGGWLMFIQPITTACKAYDAGTLTGNIIGVTIINCLFAGTVFALIAFVGYALCILIGRDSKK